MLSDEALALGVQQGQSEDLVTLVERHHDALIGYVYRLTGGNRLLSEDLVQEAFLRVWRGIGSYQYPRPFKAWLYAITTNLVRNHLKQADTRRTYSMDDDSLDRLPPTGSDSAEEDVVQAEATHDVLTMLQTLPDHQREVIVLRYYQELPLEQIAEILGIPLGTVKSRLSIGLRRLRQVMEDVYEA